MQEAQLKDLRYALCIGVALSKTTKINELTPTTAVSILALTHNIQGHKLKETFNLIMSGLVIEALSQKTELNNGKS